MRTMPLLVLTTLFIATMMPMRGEQTHPCAGAGRWFSADKDELKREVGLYLSMAETPKIPSRVIAVISPHAGYRYCGELMGLLYNTVKDRSYKRVIIIAFSHSYPVKKASVLDVDFYETPLGNIPVDRVVVRELLKSPLVQEVKGAHRREHSDENQLPFLQLALKDFKLVSVLVGGLSEEEFAQLAELIKPFMDEQTLVVTSSDFTHYGASFGYLPFTKDVKENIYKLDKGAVDEITEKDFEGFRSYVNRTGATICGKNAISLLLKLLPEKSEGKLLKYMTSGEVSGDYLQCVGYAGVVFYMPEGEKAKEPGEENKMAKEEPQEQKAKLQSESFLSPDEEKTLLKIARQTLESLLQDGKRPKLDPQKLGVTPQLKKEMGVFVTLHKSQQLRGCIGYIEGRKPLWEAVVDNTENAAFRDPRFPPMTAEELPAIDMEISVMSPLKKISSTDEIVIGKHGLLLRKGWNQGVFLPQVPVEWNWELDEYLRQICRKAGLPPTAWKEADAELFIFSAQVFGEKE